MITKVKKTISIYDMFSGGDKVLVGLSGGPDSVCLLYILKEFGLKLYIAHLNHGFRGKESDGDQRFCEELGKRLGLPVFVKKVKIKKNEESARNARYKFLEDTAKKIGANKIALGHNADDQAETVLMRLLRGAGARGLSGIPPIRGIIIRPLINVWRKEILDYLKKRNIPYRIDSSNLGTDYFRNRIRHELIPYLSKYNPNIKNILRNTGRNMAMVKDYLEGAVRQEFIIKTAKNLGLNLTSEHVDNILSMKKEVSLPKGIVARKEYGNLIFFRKKNRKKFIIELPINGRAEMPECNILITSMLCKKPRKIARKPFEVQLDYDKIPHPLKIRNRRQGDVFQPIGFKGRKKVKDIFIDEKIPERYRDSIPLVISGNEICWIPGYRIGEKFKITHDTKRVVNIKTEGVENLWQK